MYRKFTLVGVKTKGLIWLKVMKLWQESQQYICSLYKLEKTPKSLVYHAALFSLVPVQCLWRSYPGVPVGISRTICVEGAICGCLGQVEQSQWSSQRLIGACYVDIAFRTRYTQLTHYSHVNNAAGAKVCRWQHDSPAQIHSCPHAHTHAQPNQSKTQKYSEKRNSLGLCNEFANVIM